MSLPHHSKEEEDDFEDERQNNNNLLNNQSKKQRTNDDEESSEEEDTTNDPTFNLQRQAFLQNLLRSVLIPQVGGGSSNEELIASLKESGALNNARVEEALLKIPREFFVPKEEKGDAYNDAPLRLSKYGFNISAPHMYAVCLDNLNILPGMSFLDIGSGCGHFTAVASYLVGTKGISHGIDIRDDIIKLSESNIKVASDKTGIDFSNIKFFVKNCFLPSVSIRQYDRIHSGACCPESMINELTKLLLPGGILVTPFGDKLVKVTKEINGDIKMNKLMAVRYGDLIIPSEAEIKESERQLERDKLKTINIPPSTFPHDIIRLFNNQDLSDVTFIVDNKKVYAHKVILASRCDHFRAMFYSGLKESRDNEIILPNMEYNIFINVLEYIYTGDINITDPDHAIEILYASNYFKLDRLKSICEDIIKNKIDIDNSSYILQVSSRYDANQLKRIALHFILENYDQVEKTKSFEDLDKSMLLEVTKAASQYFKKEK